MATKEKIFKPGTRSRTVYDDIRSLAFSKGPGAKLPTQREMSKLFGVAQRTVAVAMTKLEAGNIISSKQGSGIYVSSALNRKTILVLLDSKFFSRPIESPFWGMLWGQFAKAAEQRAATMDEDFHFHMVRPQADKDQPLPNMIGKAIEDGRVHGVLVIGVEQAVRWIEDNGVPVIAYAADSRRSISQSLNSFIQMGVESLYEQGCRAIGLWAPALALPGSDPEIYLAVDEYRDAVTRLGMEFHPELLLGHLTTADEAPVTDSSSLQKLGHDATVRAFENLAIRKPDGLLVMDDMMADGVITALERRLGLRVGVDIKIASLANACSPILFAHQDKITLVEFDPQDISSTMLRLLDNAIAGQEPPDGVTYVHPKLRHKDAGNITVG